MTRPFDHRARRGAVTAIFLLALLSLTACGKKKKEDNPGLWGTTWTASEINTPEFGVLIQDNDDTAGALNIDQVQIRIRYGIPDPNSNELIDQVTDFLAPAMATGDAWTDPVNALLSDDLWAVYDAVDGNTNDDFLIVTDFGFALPADATIQAIEVSIEGNGLSGTASERQLELAMTKDGSTAAGTPFKGLLLRQTIDTGVIQPPPPVPDVAIVTTGLPSITVGFSYQSVLRAIGGTGIYDWSVSQGALPDGLTLDKVTGGITGEPTTVGTFDFTAQVVSGAQTLTRDYSIRVGDLVNPKVTRISVNTAGEEANGPSGDPSISPDGRFVAFTSFADNLSTGGDTNNVPDVFLRDLTCGTTELISVANDGTQGDLASWFPSISALRTTASGDFIYVAYLSDATTLVPGDTNEVRDAFVTAVQVSGCALTPSSTIRVNLSNELDQGNRIEANGPTTQVAINATGEYVVYLSRADNLVQADTKGQADVFATEILADGTMAGRTRRMSTIRRISDRKPDIFSENTIGDSSFTMEIDSHVGEKVEIMNNPGQGQIRTISKNDATTFTLSQPWDIIPDANSIYRVYSTSSGAAGAPTISADGNVVGFTLAGNHGADDRTIAPEAFRKNRQFGGSLPVSVKGNSTPSNGQSNLHALNSTGRLALFSSLGTNLVDDDTNFVNDLFIRDSDLRVTTRVHLATDGSQANGQFGGSEGFSRFESAGFSDSGTLVTFESSATNLLSPETEFNGVRDVYLYNSAAATTDRLSTGLDGVEARLASFGATISLDGSTVVFASDADNLILDDTNHGADVFLFPTGIVENPVFLTSDIPVASLQRSYWTDLVTLGGEGPVRYALAAGVLPAGVWLDPTTGALLGIPSETGTFNFEVVAMDASRPMRSSSKTFTLVVEE